MRFLAFAGTQVANTPDLAAGDDATSIPQGPNPSQLLYISLCFGFSLAVNAWIFFRVTGGLFNPAVTLALCLVGAVPFARGAFVFVAQMLGAMAASGVVLALFPGPMAVSTTLGGGTNVAQGLFIEMFLTAELVFTIIMLAVEKNKSTFLAPIGIGLSLFVSELGGVYFTGGSLNPARSFGPCVANRSFPGYHWIYWVGPILGALLAAGFFSFIKGAEYETVNPGQDFDDLEASAFDPEKDLTRPVVSSTMDAEQIMSRLSAPEDGKMDDRMNGLLEGRQPEPPSSFRNNSSQNRTSYDKGLYSTPSHDRTSYLTTSQDRSQQERRTSATYQDRTSASTYHDQTTGSSLNTRPQSESLTNVRPGTGNSMAQTLSNSNNRTRNSFTIDGPPPQIPMPNL